MISAAFIPNNHGVPGSVKGAKNLSFKEQLSYFFPDSFDGIVTSVWSPFVRVGYLRTYYLTQEEGLPDVSQYEIQLLKEELVYIFEELQCLPVVVPGKQLWKVSQDLGIQFTVNARYFKLDRIGTKKQFKPRAPALRVKATNATIEMNIRRLDGERLPSMAELKREQAVLREEKKLAQKEAQKIKVRSDKSKKYRKPPAGGRGSKKDTITSSEEDLNKVVKQVRFSSPAPFSVASVLSQYNGKAEQEGRQNEREKEGKNSSEDEEEEGSEQEEEEEEDSEQEEEDGDDELDQFLSDDTMGSESE